MERSMLLLWLLALSVCSVAAYPTTCNPDSSRTDCGYLGIDEAECEGKGCCWSPTNEDEPWCFYSSGPSPSPNGTCDVDGLRNDCGYVGIDQTECETKGCCWNPKQGDAWCFYRTTSDGYTVSSISKTSIGYTMILKYNGTSASTPYGPDIATVQVDIELQTNARLHVKFTDPTSSRWEVPTDLSPIPTPPSSPPSDPLYDVVLPESGDPFNITIIRRADHSVIFSTNLTVGPLRFVDQYLSIGTGLPNDYSIYGLGEHVSPNFKLKSSQSLTLFNADNPTPTHPNLYGSHPFYLEMRQSGLAHGVYLRNSNGMDIDLGSNYLIYRTIGGVLDFYFFLGPSPEGVVQQYQEVIGRPHMPPYWALGFHNCRYGYPNVETLEEVVANYSSAKIPLETMWTDIDYMDEYKDFTLDPVNYPQDKMNTFLDNLHDNGQRYVVITDPGIKNENGYSPYDQGLQSNAFIKDKNGNVFIGKVWPGTTAFTDFMNFDTHQYWEDQIASFLQLLPVDGIWIDMNEISNFCNGACSTTSDDDISMNRVKTKTQSPDTSAQRVKNWLELHPQRLLHSGTRLRRRQSDMDPRHFQFNPTNPPYTINNFDSKAPLNTKTLDMDALHMNGTVMEYNAHNLYGLSEAYATNKALENLKKKRSFVLSRSTFPGSGSHTGHWTGDNFATFDALEQSIVGMLDFQLFGIPLIGSDICGFIGTTSVELCTRWIEVGAFYPFSRDHNTKGAPPQELYRWPQVAEVSRKVLSIRYSLLPLYYTLFYKAHAPVTTATSGQSPAATVVHPLFFEFPNDTNTFSIDTQFLVGPSIMISPVVTEGAMERTAYFPRGRWYDWYNQSIVMEKGGETVTLSVPVEHVPIHLRGGAVIPMQVPGMTTVASRRNPFSLLVVLDENGAASGDVYLDDGESLDMSNYTYVTFSCLKSTLSNSVTGTGYASSAPPLSSVSVLGLEGTVSKATINGHPIPGVQYNSTSHSVLLSGFQTSLDSKFTITWT